MKRRDFMAMAPLLGMPASAGVGMPALAGAAETHTITGAITDVPGVMVGHYTEPRRPTGCTVVMLEDGATAAVDQRGGAPGTRETDLLNPINLVQKVNAILLAGGSAFGLAAADGVVRYLDEQGIGYNAGHWKVPIVPAAILIDLDVGDGKVRPTAESGYKACQAAVAAMPTQGNIGAGAGATVGKLLGSSRMMKGGLGTASIKLSNGIIVGAMAAVNAAGDIWDHIGGRVVAGARTEDGKHLADVMKMMREGRLTGWFPSRPGSAPTTLNTASNTTLGVIATNVDLTKTQVAKVTQMASAGFAMAVRPVNSPFDGDTVFGVATGRLKTPLTVTDVTVGEIGALAADILAQAITSAVLHASSVLGIACVADLAP